MTDRLTMPLTRDADGGARQPFSGNVEQTINPWTWFLRMSGVEIGQLNVYLGKSKDPDLERQILDTVGTYGRQLGVIGDALSVLIARADLDDLSAAEKGAMDRVKDQLNLINLLRRNARSRGIDDLPPAPDGPAAHEAGALGRP